MLDKDLISRKALIKEFEKCVEWAETTSNRHYSAIAAFEDAIRRTKRAPREALANPEEARCGKWEAYNTTTSFDILHPWRMIRRLKAVKYLPTRLGLRCSACWSVTYVDDSIGYKFCPHCGAVMLDSKKIDEILKREEKNGSQDNQVSE